MSVTFEGEVKQNRVGEFLSCESELAIGETVQFWYEGGSERGYRTVLVVKQDDESLEGPTNERNGEYRRYLREQIGSSFMIVNPFEPYASQKSAPAGNTLRVQFPEAGEKLLASLTGEQLAELYAKYVAVEGDGATYDANSGEVVVMLPAPQNKILSVGSDLLTLQNKNGEAFYLWFYPESGQIGVSNDTTGTDNAEATPEVLRDELVKFLA